MLFQAFVSQCGSFGSSSRTHSLALTADGAVFTWGSADGCLGHGEDLSIDGKAKHSPTNDWDTNAVWVDAGRAMTVTQERHTEPQDKTLSQTDCHTS